MAHKKKMKQKEIKRNKRHKVERQEAQELLRDPDALAAEIARVAEDATHSSEARAKLKALQAHQKVLAKSLAADAKRRPEELGFKGAGARGAPPRGAGPPNAMHAAPTQLLTPMERREALVFDKCHQRARLALRKAANDACQLTRVMQQRFPNGVIGLEL